MGKGLKHWVVYSTAALSLCGVLTRTSFAQSFAPAKDFVSMAQQAGPKAAGVAKDFLKLYQIQSASTYPGGYAYQGQTEGKPFKYWAYAPLEKDRGMPMHDPDIVKMDIGDSERLYRTPSSDIVVHYTDTQMGYADIFVIPRAGGAVKAFEARFLPRDPERRLLMPKDSKKTLPPAEAEKVRGRLNAWSFAIAAMLPETYREAKAQPDVAGNPALEKAMNEVFGWLGTIGISDWTARVAGVKPKAGQQNGMPYNGRPDPRFLKHDRS